MIRLDNRWEFTPNWEEQSHSFPFRSVLELIHVLDEILTD